MRHYRFLFHSIAAVIILTFVTFNATAQISFKKTPSQ